MKTYVETGQEKKIDKEFSINPPRCAMDEGKEPRKQNFYDAYTDSFYTITEEKSRWVGATEVLFVLAPHFEEEVKNAILRGDVSTLDATKNEKQIATYFLPQDDSLSALVLSDNRLSFEILSSSSDADGSRGKKSQRLDYEPWTDAWIGGTSGKRLYQEIRNSLKIFKTTISFSWNLSFAN